MQVNEYVVYEGTLQIGIHTERLAPAPATVFLAGNLHSELCAKVRAALREWKSLSNLAASLQGKLSTQQGLPLYGIRKIQPAGSLRSVDEDFNLEVTLLRFIVWLTVSESAMTADEERWMAFERNMEKAWGDLAESKGFPVRGMTIPGDNKQLGETYIDAMFELGPSSEMAPIEVTA